MNLYQVVFGQQSASIVQITRSIFLVNVLFKWPPVAILDVQKSLLTTSDQYHNFYFANVFTKWLPVANLDVQNSLSMAFLAISDQYEIKICIELFYKMAAGAHFGCPKFTFDPISNHFRSIRNFLLLIFYKMASGAHIVCPIISGHFGSICNFNVFGHLTKWLPSAILDVRKSLSIAFLAISDRYATLFF